MTLFIQVCAAFIGCIAFSIVYKAKTSRLLFCGVGAALTWLVFALIDYKTDNLLFMAIGAAAFATIFAETFARITKAPTTIYLIPCILPLVPGGSLYYTTRALVNGQEEEFSMYGQRTIYMSLGISVGIIVVSISVFYFKQWRAYQKEMLLRKRKKETN